MQTNDFIGEGKGQKTTFESDNIFIFEFKDQVNTLVFHLFNSSQKQLQANSFMDVKSFFERLEIQDLQNLKTREFDVTLDLLTPNSETVIGKVEFQVQAQLTLPMKDYILDRKVEISDRIINKLQIDLNNQKTIIKDLISPFESLSYVEKLGFVNKKQEEKEEERSCRMCTSGVESCKLF